MSKLPDFKERLIDLLLNHYLDNTDLYRDEIGEFNESECRASLKDMNQFELMNELFNEYREDLVIGLVEEFAE